MQKLFYSMLLFPEFCLIPSETINCSLLSLTEELSDQIPDSLRRCHTTEHTQVSYLVTFLYILYTDIHTALAMHWALCRPDSI